MQNSLQQPAYIKVWPTLGELLGIASRSQTYAAAEQLPVGVKVKIGGRLRLNAQRLNEYLAAGGDLAQRS